MQRALIAFGLTICSAGAGAEVEDPGWPRLYTHGGHRVTVYQPQIESWEDWTILSARAVVAVTPAGASAGDAFFGVVHLELTTSIDFGSRTVLLRRRRPAEVRFPDVESGNAAKLVVVVKEALPDERPMLYSLDRLLAAFEFSKEPRRAVEVNLEPPPILYCESPSILVMFRGEPEFQRATGTDLFYATNTNWDLFLDGVSSRYFLLNEDTWLSTADIMKGPWTPVNDLPVGFWKLPKDEGWDEVRARLRGRIAESVPVVFVTTMPAELIVAEGAPVYERIAGTHLLYVSNTDSDLFLHSEEKRHYYLVAGRWFRSETLDGPWSAATKDLPGDFARIPLGHPRGRVLVSVPGTEQAEDAIFLATIPRRATVSRKDATIDVAYEGAPVFAPIDGTQVHYAVNTPYDVLRVKDTFYCCYQGIWFVSSNPTGPWVVSSGVPEEVYTIPPTSPKHSVTYVRVYETTPDTVVVGYTAGYLGTYVAYGVLVFGAGYYLQSDDPHWHYHYQAHYFSYGAHARYSYYDGGYYRSARNYGPYGGAGRWAAYDPRAGAYARGEDRHGPRGGAYGREAYNPYSDRHDGRAAGSDCYASWGRTVAASDDAWARAEHPSGSRATAEFETSEAQKGIAGDGRQLSNFSVVKSEDGDLYVGHDGKVYRRKDGKWQRRRGGTWEYADPSEGAAGLSQRKARPPASDRDRSEASVYGDLERESRMRERGDNRASDFRSYFSTYGGKRFEQFEQRGRQRQGFGRE